MPSNEFDGRRAAASDDARAAAGRADRRPWSCVDRDELTAPAGGRSRCTARPWPWSAATWPARSHTPHRALARAATTTCSPPASASRAPRARVLDQRRPATRRTRRTASQRTSLRRGGARRRRPRLHDHPRRPRAHARAAGRRAANLRRRPRPGRAATRSRAARGRPTCTSALSRVAWERGDLAAAAEHLRRADELGEAAGLPQNPYRWRVAMARLRAGRGRHGDGADACSRRPSGCTSATSHPTCGRWPPTRARVLAALPATSPTARRWARRTRAVRYRRRDLPARVRARHPGPGSARRPRGHPGTRRSLADATALLDRLLAAAEAGGRAGTSSRCWCCRRWHARPPGDETRRWSRWTGPLRLAEPEGWVRVFTDEAAADARPARRATLGGLVTADWPAVVRQLPSTSATPELDRPRPRRGRPDALRSAASSR